MTAAGGTNKAWIGARLLPKNSLPSAGPVAEGAEATGVMESPHGTKYVIVGPIQSPSGKTALVQTVWIVDKGMDAARLVTAYPRK